MTNYTEDVVLPSEVFDAYHAGCAVWLEADGHTGIRIGFSTDLGRFEETAESLGDIPKAFRRARKKWRAKYKEREQRIKK